MQAAGRAALFNPLARIALYGFFFFSLQLR